MTITGRTAALLITLLAGGSCAADARAQASQGAREAPGPAAPRGQVVLPSGRNLQVEIADTPEKRERGYMYREAITDGEGMVFLMEQVDFHPFWMKNCKIPLDILWLDEKWKIVHLERNLPPCTKDPCPSYIPMQASLYVLEIQAGLARREGLHLGNHIIYTPPPAGR